MELVDKLSNRTNMPVVKEARHERSASNLIYRNRADDHKAYSAPCSLPIKDLVAIGEAIILCISEGHCRHYNSILYCEMINGDRLEEFYEFHWMVLLPLLSPP